MKAIKYCWLCSDKKKEYNRLFGPLEKNYLMLAQVSLPAAVYEQIIEDYKTKAFQSVEKLCENESGDDNKYKDIMKICLTCYGDEPKIIETIDNSEKLKKYLDILHKK